MLLFSTRTADKSPASPAWRRCPPGSWGLTSRGSRSSRQQRTGRQSSARGGRRCCRHWGSWVSSSSCNLGVGRCAITAMKRRGGTSAPSTMVWGLGAKNAQHPLYPLALGAKVPKPLTPRHLTSPVHPALSLLTVPEEAVHKLEEIFIFLLQLNILLGDAGSFTALTQHQEDGADEQRRALKYFLSTFYQIFSPVISPSSRPLASESEAGPSQPSARESETWSLWLVSCDITSSRQLQTLQLHHHHHHNIKPSCQREAGINCVFLFNTFNKILYNLYVRNNLMSDVYLKYI